MQPRIAVLGSLHLDLMVQAPDRPAKGETMVGSAWWQQPGGKGGNQAVAAAEAGAEVSFIGRVGRDAFGGLLRGYLAGHGVEISQVATDPTAASGMSVAIVDASGDYGAVIVSGCNQQIEPGQIERARAAIARSRVLVLQHEVNDSANLAAAQLAHAAGVRVLLNAAPAKPLAPGLVGLIDLLVVNAIEAEMLGAPPVDDLPSALIAARQLRPLALAVVVTAGPAGAAAALADGQTLTVPGLAVPVVSTHGAGDVFVGVLAAGLAADLDLAAALEQANAAAARHVATPRQP